MGGVGACLVLLPAPGPLPAQWRTCPPSLFPNPLLLAMHRCELRGHLDKAARRPALASLLPPLAAPGRPWPPLAGGLTEEEEVLQALQVGGLHLQLLLSGQLLRHHTAVTQSCPQPGGVEL